jgi:hypothetical protein
MEKKSQTERAKEIISSVKKEMDKPRLAASVRDAELPLSVRTQKIPVSSRPAL